MPRVESIRGFCPTQLGLAANVSGSAFGGVGHASKQRLPIAPIIQLKLTHWGASPGSRADTQANRGPRFSDSFGAGRAKLARQHADCARTPCHSNSRAGPVAVVRRHEGRAPRDRWKPRPGIFCTASQRFVLYRKGKCGSEKKVESRAFLFGVPCVV
jgi:hypothetical protein